MDTQILDENGKPILVIHDYELERLLECAENWAGISNNTNQNRRVLETIKLLRRYTESD